MAGALEKDVEFITGDAVVVCAVQWFCFYPDHTCFSLFIVLIMLSVCTPYSLSSCFSVDVLYIAVCWSRWAVFKVHSLVGWEVFLVYWMLCAFCCYLQLMYNHTLHIV